MSALNFRQLPVANGTTFSKISKKEDDLARYSQISNFFSRKFSFYSFLLPEFLEFSVEWFTFQKFKSFRQISVAFAAVSVFSKVLVEWKAPFAFLPWFVFEVVPRPRTLLVRSVKIYAQIRKNRLGDYKTKYKYTVVKGLIILELFLFYSKLKLSK